MSKVIAVMAVIVLLFGCAVNPRTGRVGLDPDVINKGSVATLGGGLVGAALCNQLFKGHGSRDGWTAACGIGGYFLTSSFVKQSNRVLEDNHTGQISTWQDPDGRDVSMTPTRTYYHNNQPCREYQTEVVIDGSRETAIGEACRQSDGTWRIKS